MNQKALEIFGKLFIAMARDTSIKNSDNLIGGQRRSKTMIKFGPFMDSLSQLQREELRTFAIQIIDTTLHNAMFMFESGSDEIRISVDTEDGTISDLREISDGLQGDFFIWAEKYSKEPLSHEV